MKTISYEEFIAKYKPVKNELIEGAPFDGCMFETYGKEVMHVIEQPFNKVWTVIDAEGHWIVPGYHYIDRLGYLITENPWIEDEEEVKLDDDDLEDPYNHDFQDAEE